MRPLLLRLKNFKGIKLGVLGRDEIVLDLSAVPDGIIAIRGVNGAGKTTIFDNLHPYRTMPFRASQHLADAVNDIGEKELFWEHNGVQYRSLLKINARSRTTEAYLDRREPDGSWLPLGDADGRNEAYDAQIERIIMPEKMYFLSAFRSQNAESFQVYKKSDMKSLFEKLLGLAYLIEKSDKAKEQKNAVIAEIKLKEREIETLTAALNDIVIEEIPPELLPEAEKKLYVLQNTCLMLNAQITEFKSGLSAVIERENSVKAVLDSKIAAHKNNKELLNKRSAGVTKKIADLKTVLDRRTQIEAAKELLAGLRDKISAIQSQIAERATLQERRSKEINNRSSVMSKLQTAKNKLTIAEQQSKVLQEVSCSEEEKMSCKLLAHAVEQYKKIPALLSEIRILESQVQSFDAVIADIDKKIAGLPAVIPPELQKQEREALSLASQEELLNVAEQQLDSLHYEMAEIDSLLEENDALLDAENVAAAGQLQAYHEQRLNIERSIQEFEEKHREAVELYGVAARDLEDLKQRIQKNSDNENKKKSLSEKIAAVSASIAPLNRDRAQWELIEKAFGRDGIIAYELEIASPMVSEIANTLLATMGGRFAIRFDTLRPKVGKKNEYVEVFDIKVLDTQKGEEKSLLDLSGGERVWVDEAIARAIGIYLGRSTGATVDSVFSDERDGALDENKKREYFAMKREVLKLGGYKREFFISHTHDLCEMADAVISIKRGGIDIDLRSFEQDKKTFVVPEALISNGRHADTPITTCDNVMPTIKRRGRKKKAASESAEVASQPVSMANMDNAENVAAIAPVTPSLF